MPEKDLSSMFVSGWDDDDRNVEEELKPHETPQKEILWAAENGKINVALRLLSADPDLVKVTDNDGYTPLHRACYGDHVEMVELLISFGANVSSQTDLGWQPLHSACQWNNPGVAAKLIQYGADINAESEGGQTPLHIAASHGTSYETVQVLLADPYINPYKKNHNGEIPYDIARRSSKYSKMFNMGLHCVNSID